MSIHSEPSPPDGPGYRRLFGETLLPVCAPGLLDARAAAARPADLAQHVLLCSMNRPTGLAGLAGGRRRAAASTATAA